MKRKHPYKVMGLRVGTKVWVRAAITELSPKDTLGYAHGFVSVRLETKNGMAGGGTGTVTIFDIRKDRVARAAPSTRAASRSADEGKE